MIGSPAYPRIPLKRLASVMPSNVDKHSVEGEEPVQLCNYVDVYRNERIHNDLDFMQATAKDAQIERFTLRAQDVIVTKDSEATNDIGVPAFVPHDMPGVVCGYHLAILRPSSPLIAGSYLAWALRSKEVQVYYATAATGISRYALGIGDLGMTPVPLPSKDVQERIANFLDKQTARIDALIAGKERLFELSQELEKAQYTQLIVRGVEPRSMFETGKEFLPFAPEGWRVCSFKRALSGMSQGWSPQCESRPAEEGEWGVLKVGCVNTNSFNAAENKALPGSLEPDLSCVLRKGDVLVSRANTRDLVGMAALVDEDHPNLLLCDKLYRLNLRPDWIIPSFAVLLLRSTVARTQIELGASGASSSMQNISQDVLRELVVALPPTEEQEKIVNRAREIRDASNSLARHIREHIDRLREYRSSLISAAVTGQIDINNFQLEAA